MSDYKRQGQIYDFIADYRRANGYSPTIAEIAKGLCLSKTTVHYHLGNMEIRGMIRRGENITRGIVLLSREPSRDMWGRS